MNSSPIRIVLLTTGLSRLVKPLVSSELNVVGICEASSRSWQAKKDHSTIRRILAYCVKKVPIRHLSLKDYAKKKEIPYFYFRPGAERDLITFLEDCATDLLVVYSMSFLLKSEVLNSIRLGAINLHPSYLPDYRGPNPDFWQYYDLELNPGVTVHYLDPGEDTGDILVQERVSIPLGIRSPDRLDILISEIGVRLLFESIRRIQEKNVKTIKQPRDSNTKRARIVKRNEHKKLIKWKEWPVEKVWHILRGTETWLDAVEQPKGFFRGQRWRIEGYEVLNSTPVEPGEVGFYHGKKCIGANGGVVYIKLRFRIKRLLKSWLYNGF